VIYSQLMTALLQPKYNFSIAFGVTNALRPFHENSICDGDFPLIYDLPIDHKLGLIVICLNARRAWLVFLVPLLSEVSCIKFSNT
jgi:hypothetical protein